MDEADHITEHARLAALAQAHGEALHDLMNIVNKTLYFLYPVTTRPELLTEDRTYLYSLHNQLDTAYDTLTELNDNLIDGELARRLEGGK